MPPKRKAVALISGGLDSLLAAKVVLQQGIDVEGINFFTGFCVEGHTHAIRKRGSRRPRRNNALWAAEQLGIRLHLVDIVEEYKDTVINPRHGYGANLNPCLDCKIFMVRKALEWGREHGFDFIVSGEVVGQRPKSQRSDALPLITKESGADDLLLRPLCAKLLPPTAAERNGWVDRERLHGFNGRSRKPQMALAAQFGFKDYAQPAGGCCFLTDPSYSAKLRDLWSSRAHKQYTLDDIMLLKVGRHLRPRPHFKLVIAREEGEGRFLQGYRREFTHLQSVSHRGPIALLDGNASDDDLRLAAELVARFSQGRDAPEVSVEICEKSGRVLTISVPPLSSSEIPESWYL